MNEYTLNQIRSALARLEQERSIRILHVSECDSRAWGFATENSDYDLRFCYVKLPWAGTLQHTNDTMRYKIHIQGVPCDMQGFDLQHTLRKISQSNFIQYEMFRSPIQLAKHPSFYPLFSAALDQYKDYFDLTNCCRGLMRKNCEFMQPFTAKYMLHALRFGLIAEQADSGKTPMLNLPELMQSSTGFSERIVELISSREDKMWVPDEQVMSYLNRLIHLTEWKIEKSYGQRDEKWFSDLNMVFQYIMQEVCHKYAGMSVENLNWTTAEEVQTNGILTTA